jgi:hypothetical protein
MSRNNTIWVYNQANGTAEAIAFDPMQGITIAQQQHQGWRSTWRHVVQLPGAILLYDPNAGEGYLFRVHGTALGAQIQNYRGWRSTWDKIIAFDPGMGDNVTVLFYDRNAGQGAFYNINVTNGSMNLLQLHNGWRKTWEEIIPLRFGNQLGVLFYEKTSGSAYMYTLINGNMQPSGTFTGWRSTWTNILPLYIRGATHLVFYDRNTGDGAIYNINQMGGMNLILNVSRGWRRTWKTILAPVDSGLVFLDQNAELFFYFVGPDGSMRMTQQRYYSNVAFTHST